MHNYYLQIVALITLMFLVVQLLMQIWLSKVNFIVRGRPYLNYVVSVGAGGEGVSPKRRFTK